MSIFELGVFWSVFCGSKSGGEDAVDGVGRKWGDVVVGTVFEGGCVPTMRTQESVDVTSGGELDEVAGLVDINAIEFSNETQIFKRRCGLSGLLKLPADDSEDVTCKGFGRGRKTEIVYLTEKEHFCVFECGRVDASIVGGRGEEKL